MEMVGKTAFHAPRIFFRKILNPVWKILTS